MIHCFHKFSNKWILLVGFTKFVIFLSFLLNGIYILCYAALHMYAEFIFSAALHGAAQHLDRWISSWFESTHILKWFNGPRAALHGATCSASLGPLDFLVIWISTYPKVIQRSTCCAARCYAAEDHNSMYTYLQHTPIMNFKNLSN
jgi:hypothetical protein